MGGGGGGGLLDYSLFVITPVAVPIPGLQRKGGQCSGSSDLSPQSSVIRNFFQQIITSVSDPYSVFTDPDPAFSLPCMKFLINFVLTTVEMLKKIMDWKGKYLKFKAKTELLEIYKYLDTDPYYEFRSG